MITCHWPSAASPGTHNPHHFHRPELVNPPAKRQRSDIVPTMAQTSESPRFASPLACLRVHPHRRYGNGPIELRKPMFLGDFSLDEHRRFCRDQRNLHFIHMNWTGDKQVQVIGLVHVSAFFITPIFFYESNSIF